MGLHMVKLCRVIFRQGLFSSKALLSVVYQDIKIGRNLTNSKTGKGHTFSRIPVFFFFLNCRGDTSVSGSRWVFQHFPNLAAGMHLHFLHANIQWIHHTCGHVAVSQLKMWLLPSTDWLDYSESVFTGSYPAVSCRSARHKTIIWVKTKGYRQ